MEKQKKNTAHIFKGYYYIWKEFNTKEKIIFVLMIINNILFGISTLVPIQLVSMFISKLTGEPMTLLGITLSNNISYVMLGVMAGAFLVVKAIWDVARQHVQWRFTTKFCIKLKKRVFEWALVPRKNLDLGMSTGDATYRIMTNTEAIFDLIDEPLDYYLYELISAISAIVYLSCSYWVNAIILIAGLIIQFVGIIYRNKRTIKQTAERENLTAKVNNDVMTSINNIPQVAVMQSQNVEKKEIENKFRPIERNWKERHKVLFVYWFISYVGIALSMTAIMGVGIMQAIAGVLVASQLLVIFDYTNRAFNPISDLGWRIGLIEVASSQLERVMQLKPKENILDYSASSLGTINEIELKNVSVKYNEQNQVKNINIHFKKGQLYVLKGSSGCGKSTIAKLVAGIVEKDCGSIYVNGTQVQCMYPFISQIGFLFQDPYLFNLSLAKNISYPHTHFDYQHPWVKVARIKDILDKKEKEEEIRNTSLLALSGGEQKRICIARCMLEEKDVYILDEPTNDLDSLTVEEIIKALDELKKNHIVIIVSHDKRIMDKADSIFDFDENK